MAVEPEHRATLTVEITRNTGATSTHKRELVFAAIEGIDPPTREIIVKVFWASAFASNWGVEDLGSIALVEIVNVEVNNGRNT